MPISLAFRGNIVFATHNPFSTETEDTTTSKNKRKRDEGEDEDNEDSTTKTRWIGPGIRLCIDHVLTVDHSGIIVDLVPAATFDWDKLVKDSSVVTEQLDPHAFLIPGLIDLHIHAPQYAYTGTATDRPLMGPDGWLETYTFPAEAGLVDDPDLCQQVYEGVVSTTLQMGTTTAVYFATLHLEPCKTLVDIVTKQGQRALIGKVCMDRNGPTNYCQSLQDNLREAEALIDYIHDKVGRYNDKNDDASSSSITLLPKVLPLVTPRFIPTCSPALLTSLGKMAAKHGCYITSHISESIDEVAFSRHLDATEDLGDQVGRTDAKIFDSHGLLTDKCIMAHGVFLSEEDLDLMKERQSGVAHCPLSNFFFAGGCLPCRRLMERGNRVGIGTDVAGGYSPSLLNSSRSTVIASRSLQQQIQQKQQQQTDDKTSDKKLEAYALDYRHAFYLATLGGAEALSLDNKIGTFRPGLEFDAVVMSASFPIQVFARDTIEDVFQKLCVLGDDRHVKSVYVQGKRVK